MAGELAGRRDPLDPATLFEDRMAVQHFVAVE
jgi:hypothetical protein